MNNHIKIYIIFCAISFYFTGLVFGFTIAELPKNQSKITGIAVDSNDKPIANAVITCYPMIANSSKTDPNGKFSLERRTDIYIPDYESQYIMIRDRERNLVRAELLPFDTENLVIGLSEGIILSGKVVDPNDNAIQNAEICFGLRENSSGNCYGEPVKTDEQGNFEIKAAPLDFNCLYFVRADGFGNEFVKIHTSGEPGECIQLKPVVLAFANLTVSGAVVDINDKPVADAHVFTGTPEIARTDQEGKFTISKICAGSVRVTALKPGTSLRGEIETEGGATDVKIIISENGLGMGSEPKLISLKDKSLPDMKSIFNDFSIDKVKDKNVLVCFWDYEQRPSRNCILQLAKQAKKLKENNVEIIAIQASKIESSTLDKWIQENNISFIIGIIPFDSEKVKADWSVKSLPWLILTDKEHKVTSEGFGISELEEKLGNN